MKSHLTLVKKAKEPKIFLFDLETSNLNANFGFILCAGYKELGEEKAHCINITESPGFKKDPTNDYYVVKTIGEVLGQADMLIGWYSSRFDYPYLQSRLIFHKLPILPPIQHVDGWRIAKYKMKLNSNRLASVTAFLGLEDKTALSGPIWVRAAAGHRDSIQYVVEHCLQDVVVLEQVYQRIKPLMTNHPGLGVMAEKSFACPICGSEQVQKRGFHMTRTRKYQRWQCQGCGGWSHDGQSLGGTQLR